MWQSSNQTKITSQLKQVHEQTNPKNACLHSVQNVYINSVAGSECLSVKLREVAERLVSAS
jgi:hypothetical protein